MKGLLIFVLAGVSAAAACGQVPSDGPKDPKAQKTYTSATEWLKARDNHAALDSFAKADKQDGGHCLACERQMIKLGLLVGDFKTAALGTQEIHASATEPKDIAMGHYDLGNVFLREGMAKSKSDPYISADTEFKAAIATYPNFPDAVFGDGMALAHAQQDAAAKEQFQRYISMTSSDTAMHQRAGRYLERPELVRARMAPAFAITPANGDRLSLDDLQGKVVLIDFWATWCGPCRAALPHIQQIAKKFQGEPLVILSVSLDSDESKWKDFIAQNNMTWVQYRDGGFQGSLSRLFAVNAIPHTFTIDPDGVLQDEHIGDADIEGKLKKLCSRARQMQEVSRSTAKTGD